MFSPVIKGSARYWDLGDKLIANNSRAGSMSVHRVLFSRGPVVGVMEATKPVYLLVREPVERYVSALMVAPMPPIAGNHFGLQSKLAEGPEVHLYRFPDHLAEFGRDTGLGEIPWVNKTEGERPTLTEAETHKVLREYEKDLTLYESIREPGVLLKL